LLLSQRLRYRYSKANQWCRNEKDPPNRYRGAVPGNGDSAHTDELPKTIYGNYCRYFLDDDGLQVLYKRGFCSTRHPSDGASFSSTTYENLRDVFCKFFEIKKIAATTYQVRANCVDSHSVVSAPTEFISFFELEILPRRRGLLITYLSEG